VGRPSPGRGKHAGSRPQLISRRRLRRGVRSPRTAHAQCGASDSRGGRWRMAGAGRLPAPGVSRVPAAARPRARRWWWKSWTRAAADRASAQPAEGRTSRVKGDPGRQGQRRWVSPPPLESLERIDHTPKEAHPRL